MSKVVVYETFSQIQERKERAARGRPSHWNSDNSSNPSVGGFHNPWDSFRITDTIAKNISFLGEKLFNVPPLPKDLATKIPVNKPTFGLQSKVDSDKIIATWLGHACFLIELPKRSPQAKRGPRILFDPVFSDRCSPSQWIGPKRFTPMPCKVEDIPEVDVLVISHDHYDHMDTNTIQSLIKRSPPPHIFTPLGNDPYLQSLKVPSTHTHILDWWDARRVKVTIDDVADNSKTEPTKTTFTLDVTCTPGQHFTGRGLLDRFKTLWATWAVAEVIETPVSDSEREPVKVFFGGDTGYRTVHPGEDEETVPVCPAFKEVGEKFGGFDFAMIPIGAYQPRRFLSALHCAPQDSVQLFKDIQAQKALGMHWGAWALTTEEVTEPPQKLREEGDKLGISEDVFGVCQIGDTTYF